MSEVTANISLTPISATFIVDNNNITLTPEATQLTIINGYAGISGFSGYSGSGASGYSGFSGQPGPASGYSGWSGTSGIDGTSGYSGISGSSGSNGLPGGTSGYSGKSGYSGIGSSGYSGISGYAYINVPQVLAPINYNVVLADAGKHLYHATSSAAAIYTFPANSNVSFPIGSVITIVNLSANYAGAVVTGDSLRLIGNGVAGNRSVGPYGAATLIKVATITWAIMGTNIT